MDLLIYCIVLGAIGVIRFNQTKDVSDNVGIVEQSPMQTESVELPYAQNLKLIKEPNAYTKILVELGLKRT